ncbi:hypothetical protein [Pseudomonas aeruginosa]|uniref:hypothetical protein n=1 Tax=Pseudomonas aeruginosa TaxID=287 RepID=UPI000F5F792F|nr:hypothetical protein [Pseudomonas aeruginosa]MDE8656720.1 hypothetical protein [Pseudomonas aeruginosa]MDE8664353.1 hypothetical protein [Pseudomonas aeruginosa]MDN3860004.1 hypothetical protein [Pseudomonas aeruginosa]NQA60834.1 hypothetical protein [Pseudomonas aeruginosa]HCS8192713.1 hypothetical protein [Pseudomonas aeruginosa]
MPRNSDAPNGVLSDSDYDDALSKLDIATCEAMALSQAINSDDAARHIAYSVEIYKRLCRHAVALVSAVPRSRWVAADFENWDFACVAGQSRAVMEGYLLFRYLVRAPSCNHEWVTKLLVLYLNDRVRRAKMMTDLGATEASEHWSSEAQELRERLNENPWFLALDRNVKKGCLSGKFLMVQSRDQVLEMAGLEIDQFNAVWDLLSQYAHMLPMSFTSSEPDGRGSGDENQEDKDYIGTTIACCADILNTATDILAREFPAVAEVRRGIESRFLQGPRSNRP